ncbi:hypothetical protein RIF29_28671 [Crotalaria pallida]|uniref:Uncharacterized protein n=1 Tax=Crotalaria pallida TaxID=3830 RepID=A0AAN9HVJ7_CROPI
MSGLFSSSDDQFDSDFERLEGAPLKRYPFALGLSAYEPCKSVESVFGPSSSNVKEGTRTYYEPQMCRQFGPDKSPRDLFLPLAKVQRAIWKLMILKGDEALLSDPSSSLFPSRHVVILFSYSTYQYQLLENLRHYLCTHSSSHPHKETIILRDPYFSVTRNTIVTAFKDSNPTFLDLSILGMRKRKLTLGPTSAKDSANTQLPPPPKRSKSTPCSRISKSKIPSSQPSIASRMVKEKGSANTASDEESTSPETTIGETKVTPQKPLAHTSICFPQCLCTQPPRWLRIPQPYHAFSEELNAPPTVFPGLGAVDLFLATNSNDIFRDMDQQEMLQQTLLLNQRREGDDGSKEEGKVTILEVSPRRKGVSRQCEEIISEAWSPDGCQDRDLTGTSRKIQRTGLNLKVWSKKELLVIPIQIKELQAKLDSLGDASSLSAEELSTRRLLVEKMNSLLEKEEQMIA